MINGVAVISIILFVILIADIIFIFVEVVLECMFMR